MATLTGPNVSVKESAPSVLLCAVMDHLTCYLRTGRPCSAEIALLLVDRLVADPGADAGLARRCAELCEAILDAQGQAAAHGGAARI